ncbi:hypothetical protein GCM10010124_07180 [Pilimelia terevasa]|uniref:histidine kinase n=1 Tax=Pilimelia terevasa TaxID=53372 RepID=A0A8J3BF23_9ACTN|nr:ATP-binding protein [Pilimelia terevasa]GGK17191.1 hypothetical protein GCM10010124_07180 [Pilimelia terevasa]
MLTRLRIRGKLALLTAVPLLAVVALAAVVAADRVAAADRAAATAARASLAADVGQLVQALQQERLVIFGVALDAAPAAQLPVQNELVQRRLSALRARALPEGVALGRALDAVDAYAPRRAPAAGADPVPVVDGYAQLVGQLTDALRLQDGVDGGAGPGRQLVALDAALRTDEALAVTGVYALLLSAPRFDHLVPWYHGAQAAFATQLQRFRHFATGPQQTLYTQVARVGEVVAGQPGADPRPALRAQRPPDLLRALYYRGSADRLVGERIVGDVTAAADSAYRAQVLGAVLVGGAVLGLVLLVVALCVVVGQLVVRPLTRLTASAERIVTITEDELLRVVDDELEAVRPVRLDPVATDSRDEIGDLARAIEAVQRTAVSLVHRQVAVRRNVAQMFGHVGRRTQSLVARQAAGLAALAAAEGDPVRRADLVRLQHVTHRLRRNAGSLVVISGEPGAEGHTAPMGLREVARLALAVVEDGDRVDLEIPADLGLAPGVVGDAVLLLGELIENACVFSPPNRRVTVAAQRTRGGARIRVVDGGIGMAEAQRATENTRLRHRERLDLAPTGALGLFVVGRLARRHRLRVGLAGSPGGGTTAIVELPARLLAGPAPEPPEAVAAIPPAAPPGAALDRARAAVVEGRPWSGFIPAQRQGEDRVPSPETLLSTDGVQPGKGAPVPAPQPMRTGTLPGSPPPTRRPGSAPGAPATPARATAVRATAVRATAAGPPPGDGPLARRVPGATLATRPRPAAPAPGAPQHDPGAVRALVEQFESGVTRALREYGAEGAR